MDKSNLDLCKAHIKVILETYGCEIISADEWTQTLIRERSTNETVKI